MRKPGFVPVTIIEIHESVNKMFWGFLVFDVHTYTCNVFVYMFMYTLILSLTCTRAAVYPQVEP